MRIFKANQIYILRCRRMQKEREGEERMMQYVTPENVEWKRKDRQRGKEICVEHFENATPQSDHKHHSPTSPPSRKRAHSHTHTHLSKGPKWSNHTPSTSQNKTVQLSPFDSSIKENFLLSQDMQIARYNNIKQVMETTSKARASWRSRQ